MILLFKASFVKINKGSVLIKFVLISLKANNCLIEFINVFLFTTVIKIANKLL